MPSRNKEPPPTMIRWCPFCKDLVEYLYKCQKCNQTFEYSTETKGLFHFLQGKDYEDLNGPDSPEWRKRRQFWNRLAELLGMS